MTADNNLQSAVDRVREYAESRCTEEHADYASASWILHLLDDEEQEAAPTRAVGVHRVAAELDRLEALPTVQADDGRADRFSVGARWAIRMVREVIDGTRDPNEPTLSGQEFIAGLLHTLDSPVDEEASDG